MHPYRSHTCGELRPLHVGAQVQLSGWLGARRDLGGLMFLQLEDAHGSTQLVALRGEVGRSLRAARLGGLVTVTGVVQLRGERNANPSQATGAVEVLVQACRVWDPGRAEDEPLVHREQDPIVHVVAAARRAIDELGFVEAFTDAPIWTQPPRACQAERRARIDRTGDQVLLELDAAFVAEADLGHVVEHVLRAVAVRLGDQAAAPPLPRPWADRSLPDDVALVWAQGPARSNAFSATFHHDPCGILLALGRGEAAGDRADVLLDEVAALELWSGTRSIGVGAIRNHELTEQARLGEALQAAGPTVRARAAAHARALQRGAPPTGWFILDLTGLAAHHATRSFGAGQRPMPRVGSWAGLEAALTEVALGGARLSLDELHRRAARVERRDSETAAALLASLQVDVRPQVRGSLEEKANLARLLASSAITVAQCDRLLDLFPHQKPRVLAMPADELYQWLWSILGNDFVRDVVDDDAAYARVQLAIADGVITDYRQLVYLDAAALADLEACRRRSGARPAGGGEQGALLMALRRVLAELPSTFSTLLAALADADDDVWSQVARATADGRADDLMHAAQAALCGPITLPLFLASRDRPAMLEALVGALHRQAAHLYPNRPIDVAALAHELADRLERSGFSPRQTAPVRTSPRSWLADLVFELYRPINMSVRTIAGLLERVPDARADFQLSGVRLGGPHWDEGEGCYTFALPSPSGDRLRLFPSKNIASFFSKTAAGICTARDVELYARTSHLHLNLVAPDGAHTVGNVQLHVITDHGKRIFIVRAINASASWIRVENAQDIVSAVLVCVVEMAMTSGIDEVHLGEGLDLWHYSSGRFELMCVLDDFQNRLERVALEEPLLLFRFSGIDHMLVRSYRLWPLPPGLSRLVGLGVDHERGMEGP